MAKEIQAREATTGSADDSRTAPVSVPTPNVYQCIAAVSAEIAKTGIAKDRKNEQQHYTFRGIDEVYNALAPILARCQLVILPRMVSRTQVERLTAKGGTLFFTAVEAEFDFVSAADGSKTTVRTFGEAMDSGDKSTNKAMSAAYKYAAMQTFCIPTEGDNDADATTHDPIKPAVPAGGEDWLLDLEATAQNGVAALKSAWEKSKPELRKWLTSTQNDKWEALKKKAALVKEAA